MNEYDLIKQVAKADLVFALKCREELQKGSQGLQGLFATLDMPSSTGYNKIAAFNRVFRSFGGDVFARSQNGRINVIAGRERVLDAVERIVDTCRILVSKSDKTRIRIGTTNILFMRIVADFCRQLSVHVGSDADFEFLEAEYQELIKAANEGAVDIVICPVHSSETIAEDELIYEFEIPRAIIFPLNHPRLGPDFRKRENHWGLRFKTAPKRAWRELDGELVALLADRHSEPNFPWDELGHCRQVRVNSYSSAHAYARTGVAIAITHQQLLTPDEEASFTVVDVSKKLGRTRVCAFSPKKSRTLRTQHDSKVISVAAEEFRTYLSGRVRSSRRRGWHSQLLRYRYLWHTTSESKRSKVWVRGTSFLDVTPANFVKGIQKSENNEDFYRVFGRLLPGHLVVNGTSASTSDQYSIDFDLNGVSAGKDICGFWLGRDEFGRQTMGSCLLTKSDRSYSAKELNRIVGKRRPYDCTIAHGQFSQDSNRS